VLLVFAKQELVGHSGNVVADDDMPRFRAGQFFVRSGHGAWRIEVINKQFLKTTDGTIAVFCNGWVIVDALKEEALHLRVALREHIAKAGKPAWGAANVVNSSGSGRKHAMASGFDEIRGKTIKHAYESGVEFELLAPGGVSGIDRSIGFGENRDFVSQSFEIEKAGFTRVIKVRRVVRNFIDPINKLAFQRRTKVEQILGKMGEFLGGVIMGMLDNALADFKGEIQAREFEIGALELFDDAERLKIVIETRAMGAH